MNLIRRLKILSRDRSRSRHIAAGWLATGLLAWAPPASAAVRVWEASDINSPDWSTAGNWSGDAAPGPDDEVRIEVPVVRNMVMDQDFTISAFTFLPSSNVDDLSLDLGANTLTIQGPDGFFMSSAVNNVQASLTITGAGGALIVNHPDANFVHDNVTQGTSQGRLIMEDLDRFEATVNRFGVGDASLNDRGFQQAQRTLTSLAKVNIIRASFTDDYSANAYNTAIQFFKNAPFNNGQGFEANLGIQNEFYADSFGVSMGRAGSDQNIVRFNPAFTGGSPKPTAKFRNLDGTSRMTLLAVGVDANTEEGVGSSNRARIDLRGGEVDMLVDTILLAVNRPNQTVDANASIRGRLFIDDGVVDANVVRAGYQKFAGDSRCQGFIQVDGSAELIVNDYIELGFATGDHPEGTGGYAAQGFGQISMDGGVIRANTIRIGSEITENNAITMRNGADLEVNTTLASADLKLNTLDMNDSTLTLHVDAANSEPYVHVVNLLSGGAANTIAIASIENLNDFPAQIALISCESAPAPNFAVSLPDGLSGFIVNNDAQGTIDVSITGTEAPAALVWSGASSGDWDTSSQNWLIEGGDPASFSQGDFVIFNDDATGPTTVNVVGSVIPGQSPDMAGITVNNAAKDYTLTGGDITGTGRTVKEGAGSLTMNLFSEAPLIVNEGAAEVTFSGSVGQVTVAEGANFRSEGAVAGLVSSGESVNEGEINGPASIQGGRFENSGLLSTEPASIAIGADATVVNEASGVMDVAGGDWEVPPGAALVNNGQINNRVSRLNVGGILSGTGVITDLAPNFGDGRVSINRGGTLSPGASLGLLTVEGRFDLNPGGRLLVEVDLDDPAKHDVVGVDVFGNIRGTIVMTNIGATPFAVGQNFHVVSNNFGLMNFPLNPNLDFSVEPDTPGPGLAWDVSNLVTNGVIAIIEGELEPPTITVGSSPTELTIAWPESYLGWQLQVQTGNLEFGVSGDGADWSPVAGSESDNQFTAPIDPAQPWEFFRLSSP